MFPKLFFCSGCSIPSRTPLCAPCKESLYWNEQILPSPTQSIEGVAPLIISLERGQKLIRRWKDNRGSSLARQLFRMPPGLRRRLLELHLLAIIPIPQSQMRSYERGHDSAREVARFFSEQLAIPILPLLELRESNPRRQTGMSRFDRDFSKNPFGISRHLDRKNPLYQRILDQEQRGTPIRFLIVDDLITSGSTLSKASAVIKDWIPDSRCWAGSLGFRPKLANARATQCRLGQEQAIPQAALPAESIQSAVPPAPSPSSGPEHP